MQEERRTGEQALSTQAAELAVLSAKQLSWDPFTEPDIELGVKSLQITGGLRATSQGGTCCSRREQPGIRSVC